MLDKEGMYKMFKDALEDALEGVNLYDFASFDDYESVMVELANDALGECLRDIANEQDVDSTWAFDRNKEILDDYKEICGHDDSTLTAWELASSNRSIIIDLQYTDGKIRFLKEVLDNAQCVADSMMVSDMETLGRLISNIADV